MPWRTSSTCRSGQVTFLSPLWYSIFYTSIPTVYVCLAKVPPHRKCCPGQLPLLPLPLCPLLDSASNKTIVTTVQRMLQCNAALYTSSEWSSVLRENYRCGQVYISAGKIPHRFSSVLSPFLCRRFTG